jgi:hypothetical protein
MLACFLVVLLTTSSGVFIMFEPPDQDIPQDETAIEPEPAPEISGSEIKDATAIFLLRLETAVFGAWIRSPEGQRSRTAKLQFTLLEVFKGHLIQKPGEAFDLAVLQHGDAGFEDPGLWSHVKMAPGTELIAFTNGPSNDARLLLSDRYCIRLPEASGVLDDTRAAMLIENENLPPVKVLTLAATSANRFGDLFARYVWSRIKNFVLDSDQVLDSYLRLVENPHTRSDARDAYLMGLDEDLGLRSRPRRESEIMLAQSMFRLLLLPEAQPLYPVISGVLLPNLLRADAKAPKYTPAEILGPAKLDRAALLRVVSGLTSEEERAKKLVAWLAK